MNFDEGASKIYSINLNRQIKLESIIFPKIFESLTNHTLVDLNLDDYVYDEILAIISNLNKILSFAGIGLHIIIKMVDNSKFIIGLSEDFKVHLTNLEKVNKYENLLPKDHERTKYFL